MNNELVNKQMKALVNHMKDYQQAFQVSKKAETAIFNKHRLPEGDFGPGLRDELSKTRYAFAEEWGADGWRNRQFVENQIDQAQRPTDEEIDKMYAEYQAGQQSENSEDVSMHKKTVQANDVNQGMTGQQFADQLKSNQKQRKQHKPRLG